MTNRIEIAKINHMSKLGNQIENTGKVFDFSQFNPAIASHYLMNYMTTLNYVQLDIENGLEQAQLQRLSHFFSFFS